MLNRESSITSSLHVKTAFSIHLFLLVESKDYYDAIRLKIEDEI